MALRVAIEKGGRRKAEGGRFAAQALESQSCRNIRHPERLPLFYAGGHFFCLPP